MKNIKNILIPILLLPLLFYACKDDPVTPTEDFAPARFNWRTMDINGHGFAGIWAMDTNRIFLLNHYDKSLYIESNGNVTTHYVGEYYLNEIKGISENEVYLFSTQIGGNMTIIKWNGGGFEYYATSVYITGNNYYSVRGCVVSTGNIWILSRDGICKFNGSNIINYSYEDPLLLPVDLFLSNENKVQYIATRTIDTFYTQQSLFEFQDTGFVRVYNSIGQPDPGTGRFIILHEINGYKIGMEFNEIPSFPASVCAKYFNGTSFSGYFCFNKIITYSWGGIYKNPVGVNPQSFIFLANSSEIIFKPPEPWQPTKVGILNWNGNNVSKEIGLLGYVSPYPYEEYILYAINQDNYLILEPFSIINGYNTLYIGTKK